MMRWSVMAAAVLVAAVCLHQPAVAQERPTPAPGARSAIVVDADTGAVLYERNARVGYAPASLTKMVTALVAVERAPLDHLVKPVRHYNVVPVIIGLEPGDTLTLHDALYGLMLNSGNDAALAIAEATADGSVERFVGWMNELAARLGLQHTRFKNPHGLDQDGHAASAYDMAIVGRALMRQPVLAEMVGQSRRVVEGPPRWVFRSTNPLLGVYEGVDGIKTGFDDNAGRCLAATALRDGRRAIAVVMNSQQYGADAADLLDFAFDDERWGRPRHPAAQPSRGILRVAMLRADLGSDNAPATLGRANQLLVRAAFGQVAP
jgi:serine-type D-Ala-D-Ala carboxypeptidase (penicillin-binding protein 5/6)